MRNAEFHIKNYASRAMKTLKQMISPCSIEINNKLPPASVHPGFYPLNLWISINLKYVL